MIGWLYRALIGRFRVCEHHWEILHEVSVFTSSVERPIGQDYHLQCKNCGDLKFMKTRS
jgi:hypothetical protein